MATSNLTDDEKYNLFIQHITLQDLRNLVDNNVEFINRYDNNDQFDHPIEKYNNWILRGLDNFVNRIQQRHDLVNGELPEDVVSNLNRSIDGCKAFINALLTDLLYNNQVISETLIHDSIVKTNVDRDNDYDPRDVDEYILKDNNFIMTYDHENPNRGIDFQRYITNDVDFKRFFEILGVNVGKNYDMNIQIPNNNDNNFKLIYIKFIFIMFISNLIYLIEQYKQNKGPPNPIQETESQEVNLETNGRTSGGRKSKNQRKSKKQRKSKNQRKSKKHRKSKKQRKSKKHRK